MYDTPCVAGKPGKFLCRWTALEATAYGAKTADVKSNAVWIRKAVSMAAADRYALLVMCDNLPAGATT